MIMVRFLSVVRNFFFVFAVVTLIVGPSSGAPVNNIVQMTAAQFGTPSAKTISVPGGNSMVASKTGALNYNFPIVVPPGRLGIQPSLSLNYSSQNPHYGGLAAGWTFSIPEIRVDHSRGKQAKDIRWVSDLAGGHRLVPVVEFPSSKNEQIDRSLAGLGLHRAIYDDSYSRYDRVSFGENRFGWRVQTFEGLTHIFGAVTDHFKYQQEPGSGNFVPSNFINFLTSNDRAPLTSTFDLWGNRVDYYYSFRGGPRPASNTVSFRLERIEYTKNPAVSVNGIDHHAEIHFEYGDRTPKHCGASFPVGSKHTFRSNGTNSWIDGADRLDRITSKIYSNQIFVPVRRVELTYDEECSTFAGATRFLRTISQSAPADISDPSGAWIDLPPTSFAYGDPEPVYGAFVPFDIDSYMGHGSTGLKFGSPTVLNGIEWGYRLPKTSNAFVQNTIQSKMIDLDGDGVLDRIQSDLIVEDGKLDAQQNWCRIGWEPGRIIANNQTETPEYEISKDDPRSVIFSLPRIGKWLGNYPPSDQQYCSISGHINNAKNLESECDHLGNQLTYRFMDIDNDGRPDLVTGFSYDPSQLIPIPPTIPPNVDISLDSGGPYLKQNSIKMAREKLSLISSPYQTESPKLEDDALFELILKRLSPSNDMWTGSWRTEPDAIAMMLIGDGPSNEDPFCRSAREDLEQPTSACDWPESCGALPNPGNISCNCNGLLIKAGAGSAEHSSFQCKGDPNNGGSGPGFPPGGGGLEVPTPTEICQMNALVGRQDYGYKDHRYQLKWYRNLGPEKGFFDLNAAKIMISPIGLDIDGGQGPVRLTEGAFSTGRMGSGPIGQNGAFIDINGDGFIDTVRPVVDDWQVHLGDGRGNFNTNPNTGKPYIWPIGISGSSPSSSVSNITGNFHKAVGSTEPWRHRTYTTNMLVDVNGDGLVDLLRFSDELENGTQSPSELSSVFLNTGRSFQRSDYSELDSIAAEPNSGNLNARFNLVHSPSNVSAGPIKSSNGSDTAHQDILQSADSETLVRIVDWDQDGRPDLQTGHQFEVIDPVPPDFIIPNNLPTSFLPGEPTNPIDNKRPWRLFLNDGQSPLLYRGSPLTKVLGDLTVIKSHSDTRWWISTNFIDVTGDGVSEQVSFEYEDAGRAGAVKPSVTGIDLTGGVSRLMKSVDNGQGLIQRISYKPYNDPRVAANSRKNNGMPQHLWVVESIRSDDLVGSINTISEIKYGDPVWNLGRHPKDVFIEPNPYGFRGFDAIQTSAVHGLNNETNFAVTEQRYEYDLDWSGRQSAAVVYTNGFPVGDGSDRVASISESHWIERSLFDGKSLSYVIERDVSRNCETPSGQFKTENNCAGGPVSSETVTTHQYHRSAGSVDLASSPIGSWASDRGGYLTEAQQGARITREDKKLVTSNDQYHLLTLIRESHVGTGSNLQQVARTTYTPDLSQRYIQKEAVFFSDSLDDLATSSVFRNEDTGQIKNQRKPNQNQNGPLSELAYEGFQITPASAVNELDHNFKYETDLAIGEVTQSTTSNIIECSNSSGPEGSKSDYDGFGRLVRLFRFGCNRGGQYAPILIDRFEYTHFTGTTPASTRSFGRIDLTVAETETDIFYDGFGRPVSSRILTDNGYATTEYKYGENGQLEKFSVPNPDKDSDMWRSSYAYKYDVLNRQIGMRVPNASGITPDPNADIITWNSFVGVDVSFGFENLLRKKVKREHLLDGSPVSETTSYLDNFEQLAEVRELLDDGSYALTKYEYDGNGNLETIVDPDGLDTELIHDWGSRRVKITRGGRAWQYAYDRNSNLITVTAPIPSGADFIDYQKKSEFDDLDRVVKINVPPRDLSVAEQNLLGTNTSTVFSYDAGYNGIGRLSAVTGPLYRKTFSYENWGNVSRETFEPEQLQAGFLANVVSQWPKSREFNYNLQGDLISSINAEGLKFDLEYDAARRPSLLFWDKSVDPDVPNGLEVTRFERNASGSITNRTSPCVERVWNYDQLGRVQTTFVSSVPNSLCQQTDVVPDELIRESMTYYDANDVRDHFVKRGAESRQIKYSYDTRHQLATALEVDGAYESQFTYYPAGRILTATVAQSAGGPQDLSRDVSYTYGDHAGGVDGHAVKALVNASTNVNFADYKYDLSGNVIERTEVSETSSVKFRYDGEDRQRIVTTSSGSEEIYYYDETGQRFLAVALAADGTTERMRFWFGDTEYWFRSDGSVEKAMSNLSLGNRSVGRIDTEHGNADLEFSFHNGLSHLMGTVDVETTTLSTAYIYGPFGELLWQSGSTDDHVRRFNGKESDEVTGLSYYGFRYYDALSLTWTQGDPIYRFFPDLAYDEPRKMNVYTFSLNNPLRYLDPDGLEATAHFSPTNGSLLVRDNTTGAWAFSSNVITGLVGKTVNQEKGPVPVGSYSILEHPFPMDEAQAFRLEANDATFGDDQVESGRSKFRLHRGSFSWGCVTCVDDRDYRKILDVFSKTNTEKLRKVKGISLKGLGTHDEFLKQFGTLHILDSDTTVEFNPETGLIYLAIENENQTVIQPICELTEEGACQ